MAPTWIEREIAEHADGVPGLAPPFMIATKTIYARPASEGGDDVNGEGTAMKPYRTFQRAVRAVQNLYPSNSIPPGIRVHINITGVTEVLPPDYKLPAWKCADITDAYVSSPYFVYICGVNIEATPRLVTLIPASDATITPGARAADVIDPVTKLRTIVLTGAGAGAPRASWAGNALKGKFVIGANQSEGALIYESTSTTLKTNQGAAPFTGPLQIMEPSAHLSGTNTEFNGCLNAYNCDSLAFLGIKITSLNGGYGLTVVGSGIAITQFCELESATFEMSDNQVSRIGRTWHTGFTSFSGNVFLVGGLMDNCSFPATSGPLGEVTIRRMVFDTCPPVLANDFVRGIGNDAFQEIALPAFNVRETLIKNGTGHGLVYNGSVGRVIDVDIYGCQGDGVHADFGQGLLELRNVRTTGAANV